MSPPDINSLSPTLTPTQSNQETQPSSQIFQSQTRNRMTASPQQRFSEGQGSPPAPSHAHSPTSLAAAAALNAGLQNEERSPAHGSLRQNPNLERRRSSIRMSLAMNDPGLPAPGELAASPAAARRGSTSFPGPPSPIRHARAPSLGELHQELENEQEAQVVRIPPSIRKSSRAISLSVPTNYNTQNRLLGMIRRQQAQIESLQSQQPGSSVAIDDSNPPSDVSRSHTPSHSSRRQVSMSQALAASGGQSHTSSPSLRAQQPLPQHINTEFAPIRGNSGSEEFPSLAQTPSGVSTSSLRDESAFYQAETQSLTRENQMLKSRIRELERQLGESGGQGAAGSHSPVIHSALYTAPAETLSTDTEETK
jgi:hypothetical protein